MRTVLVLLTLCVCVMPAAAQGETYTWSPYEFKLTLPDGWAAMPDDDRLLLGLPDDVNRVAAGEISEDNIVAVQLIEPLRDAEDTLMNHVPYFREVEPDEIGQHLYVDFPLIAERQIRLIYVEPNYLLTASAPAAKWDAFEPVLNEMIDSIEAGPLIRTPAETLTQDFRWHGLSLSLPDSFVWNAVPDTQTYIVTTQHNRMSTMARFQVETLWLDIVRLSHLRSALSPDSLSVLRGFWYDPDRMSLSDISVSEINGIPAAMVDIADENQTGRAVLLLAQDDAYLIAGMASAEQWSASEEALFEAVLATVQLE